MSKLKQPRVGKIVHYRSYESPECSAAVITEVSSPTMVSITIFYPRGNMHRDDVVYNMDPEHPEDTWHWPEKAKQAQSLA